jgi:rhodanese-related sulfurtransferase
MEDISVTELKGKLDKNEDFELIDVREVFENEAFNIGGKLIPLGDLLNDPTQLPEDKSKEIVVYCRSGQRSHRAKLMLENEGYTAVRNLLGGMLQWQDECGIG